MKIKLRKTDKQFTEYMRPLQDYTCQRCGKKYVFNGVVVGNLQNLGVSHYYSRARENTRFDTDNCDLLCSFPCHRLWETVEREEYKEFMIKKLGQEGFGRLTLAANLYSKRDDVMDEIILKAKIKELDETLLSR